MRLMTLLRTNRLKLCWQLALLNQDYDFYQVCGDDGYKISYAANFLEPSSQAKILAIVFEKRESFWFITVKNALFNTEINQWLQANAAGQELRFSKKAAADVPENIRFQLLLNSLATDFGEYQNLTGKLIICKSDWMPKNLQSFEALELKITQDLALKLIAHKYTSLKLKDMMDWSGKTVLQNYPQYFWDGKYLRRVQQGNLNDCNNFIQKPLKGQRGQLNFLDLQDEDKFFASKIGTLAEILVKFKQKFGSYVTFEFIAYEITKKLEYRQTDFDCFEPKLINMLNNRQINLVDEIKSSNSTEVIEQIEQKIGELFPKVSCQVTSKVKRDAFNIRYVYEKQYYAKNKLEDIHQKKLSNAVIQHFTLENCALSQLAKNQVWTNEQKAILYTILKEMLIKEDLLQQKISLFSWEKFAFKGTWSFATKIAKKIYIMQIKPDGSFIIRDAMADLFIRQDYELYLQVKGVIGVIVDDYGNVNLIKETSLSVLSEVAELGELFADLALPMNKSADWVSGFLKQTFKKTDDIRIQADLKQALSRANSKLTYSRKEFIELLGKKKYTRKFIANCFKEQTGHNLVGYVRNQKSRQQNLGGLVDINYINLSDDNAYYCVGEIGNGMKAQIVRSSRIREICTVPGSKLIMDKVLELMAVKFVRYNQLTVLPFPFKYLLEYHLQYS